MYIFGRLLLVGMLCLAACRTASAMGNREAATVLARFRKLEPPFGAARARRVLAPSHWLGRADVHLMDDIVGEVPVDLAEGGACFNIFLTNPKGLRLGNSVWLRTTGNLSTVAALKRFLHGHAPSGARVLEYALVHDTLWPVYRIEHRDSKIKDPPDYGSHAPDADVPADFLPADGTLAGVLQTPVSGSFHGETAGVVVGKLCAQLSANSVYQANTTGQPHPTFTGDFQAVPLRTALYRVSRQSHLKIEWIEESDGRKTISARE